MQKKTPSRKNPQKSSQKDSKPLGTKADQNSNNPEESPVNESGLSLLRYFSDESVHPFEQIEWEERDAALIEGGFRAKLKQENVEAPKIWSQQATNIAAARYFYGKLDSHQRETSIKQMIDRVARTITAWGEMEGYFRGEDNRKTFYNELSYLLVHQLATFSEPVWFNAGIDESPMCASAYINTVKDSMDNILDLVRREGIQWKNGGGSGSNYSTIRSSQELLSNGGRASGPLDFLKGFDRFAGAINSGGKMQAVNKAAILNIDHPDVEKFIKCKAEEEKKAWTLIDAGFDPSDKPGGAYHSIAFQNEEHIVRVNDEFMRAIEKNDAWTTREVTSGEPMDSYHANNLVRMIAAAVHTCGNPGIQFESTINDWHTCPQAGHIEASNNSGEFMFLDDTACPMAAVNLAKFIDDEGHFDAASFRQTVRIMVIALDIIVARSGYPGDKIARRSRKFRPIGLGFANLGQLLMSLGLAYDSEEGRAYASAVTSLLCGQAYLTSGEIAEAMGVFSAYSQNRSSMLNVVDKHRRASHRINRSFVPRDLMEESSGVWDEAYAQGDAYGYRNAQVTAIGVSGRSCQIMDCDTAGIEPANSLVKYKKLVDGGMLKFINPAVTAALKKLGYKGNDIPEIISYIDANNTIEGAKTLKDSHLRVFYCSEPTVKGTMQISYMGHLNMMAALQPFLSGALARQLVVSEKITVEEICEAIIRAWRLGLKQLTIVRQNARRNKAAAPSSVQKTVRKYGRPYRRRLPDERQSITHKLSIGGHEGYITVGMYEDGSPGEIFIVMAKEGTVISGLMDSFATAISLALQYGVPLKVLCDKFSDTRFEPSGFTGNAEIPMAKSIMDYIFSWLNLKFLAKDEKSAYKNAPGSSIKHSSGIQIPAAAAEAQAATRKGSRKDDKK